jgi:hypothetical protein
MNIAPSISSKKMDVELMGRLLFGSGRGKWNNIGFYSSSKGIMSVD